MNRKAVVVGYLASLLVGCAVITTPAAGQDAAQPGATDDAGKIVQSAPRDFADWKGAEAPIPGYPNDHVGFQGLLRPYGATECKLNIRRIRPPQTQLPPDYDCNYYFGGRNTVAEATAMAGFDQIAKQLKASHPDWPFSETNDRQKDTGMCRRVLKAVLPNVTIELNADNYISALTGGGGDGVNCVNAYNLELYFYSTLKDAPFPGPIPVMQ